MAHAQDSPGNAVAEFLNVDPGARAGSLAGAFCAMAGDLSALPYNPAALATLSSASAVLHHTNWYQSTYQEYAALGAPVNGATVFAASFGYLHYGTVAGYDTDNNPTGDFSPSDAVVSLALARRIGDMVSVGLAGKYFRENLGSGGYAGWAVDVGALYRRGSVSLGLAALNLGPQISAGGSDYPLPRRFRVGVGYTISSRLLTTADVQLASDGVSTLHQGAEYGLTPSLFLRAGYHYGNDARGDAGSSWTVGGGLLIHRARFDYNYLPGGVLGDVHRLTVSFGG